MKKAVFIIMVILLLGTLAFCITHDVSPTNCYRVTLTTSSVTGEVLDCESDYYFVDDFGSLDKWINDEGVAIRRDTVRHRYVITMKVCVEPDKKPKQ